MRSNNIVKILSHFFPNLQQQHQTPDPSDVEELMSLIVSVRYHHLMEKLVRMVITQLPTFFASQKNVIAVTSTSSDLLQLVSGSYPNKTSDIVPLQSRVLIDIATLTSSSLFDLLDRSVSIPMNKRRNNSNENGSLIGCSIESHLKIVGLMTERSSRLISVPIRAKIDESVLRLLWL